jgi:hypothetical protein
LTIGGGGEVGVVTARGVLDGDKNVVVLGATFAIVVTLEVVCGLGKA